MKKIVLLTFLCLVTSGALAVVGGPGSTGGTGTGCTGYETMLNCNSASDAYTCYWGYTRDFTSGPMSYKCYECTNLPLADNILVSSNTETQPTISWLTAKTQYIDYSYGAYREFGNVDGFCPILVSCPAGYGLKLYINPKCSALSAVSDCRYQISCEECAMGTFDRETRLVRLSAPSTSADYGLYYVRGQLDDIDGTSTFILDNTGMVNSKMYGCGACGANAHVNTDGNNCDCDDGYGYYDSAGRVRTTNVGENKCVPRTYKIYLNTGSSDSKYIKYLPGTGYDLDLDGVYGDDGTSLDSVVSVTTPKKKFEGWYFCGCPQGTGCVCDAPMWTSNTINNNNNIVDTCKTNTDFIGCSIDEYDTINLYKWWSWKTYTVKYADGSNKTKTCTYNSDCVIDYTPTTTVPGGKLFKNWVYSGQAINVGDNFKTIEQPQPSEFSSNQVSLDPSYTDCPAGYYCKNNVQTECKPGTYCLAGVSAETPCPSGYYCPDTKNSPKECGKGNYCPEGSDAQTPCPQGNFCDEEGMSNFKSCVAGYFCPEGSDTQKPCTAGHYCPEKSAEMTNCPVGTTSTGGSKDVAGAKAITDCYVSDKTQFKDSGFSFTLPITSGTVKYKGRG